MKGEIATLSTASKALEEEVVGLKSELEQERRARDTAARELAVAQLRIAELDQTLADARLAMEHAQQERARYEAAAEEERGRLERAAEEDARRMAEAHGEEVARQVGLQLVRSSDKTYFKALQSPRMHTSAGSYNPSIPYQ